MKKKLPRYKFAVKRKEKLIIDYYNVNDEKFTWKKVKFCITIIQTKKEENEGRKGLIIKRTNFLDKSDKSKDQNKLFEGRRIIPKLL